MNPLARICLAAAMGFFAVHASAESLRCDGGSSTEGDSRLSVLYKCGEPMLKDAYCSPVYYSQTLNPVPDWVARAYVPCDAVEVWLYDRGPGNLMATVRFRYGIVQSIRFGQEPR